MYKNRYFLPKTNIWKYKIRLPAKVYDTVFESAVRKNEMAY
jgi:hypothetical protein